MSPLQSHAKPDKSEPTHVGCCDEKMFCDSLGEPLPPVLIRANSCQKTFPFRLPASSVGILRRQVEMVKTKIASAVTSHPTTHDSGFKFSTFPIQTRELHAECVKFTHPGRRHEQL
jgi:hypothetical protein